MYRKVFIFFCLIGLTVCLIVSATHLKAFSGDLVIFLHPHFGICFCVVFFFLSYFCMKPRHALTMLSRSLVVRKLLFTFERKRRHFHLNIL